MKLLGSSSSNLFALFQGGRSTKTSQGVDSKKRTCMCHVSILALNNLQILPWKRLGKMGVLGFQPTFYRTQPVQPPYPRVVQKFCPGLTHPSVSCLPILSWLSKRYQFNLIWNLQFTPWKMNMEPTSHPFRKENDLPKLHDYVPY